MTGWKIAAFACLAALALLAWILGGEDREEKGERMKLKSIAKLVKKAGALEIWDGGAWIGTGKAMYQSPVPGLNEDQILSVLDLTAKEQEKIKVRTGSTDEEGVCLEDRPQDSTLVWPQISLNMGGDAWIPFQHQESGKLACVRADLLSPMKDSREDLRVCVRWDAKAEPYLVISTGWMVQAMIRPESPSGLWGELAKLFVSQVDQETGEVRGA